MKKHCFAQGDLAAEERRSNVKMVAHILIIITRSSTVVSQDNQRNQEVTFFSRTVCMPQCFRTFPTMSRCPWLAARCRGVSSPRFMTLMRAPLMMSMSTTLERPSLQAQWRGLKPWSSLQGERNIHIQQSFHKNLQQSKDSE